MYLFVLLGLLCLGDAPAKPRIAFSPHQYACLFTRQPLSIDGRLDEPAWQEVRWSSLFLDIEGTSKPAPIYDTRIALLWDDQFLYVAARLEEPHIWAAQTQRDNPVDEDNNFELYIDPDGDSHDYVQLELNALGIVRDLFLTRPYRDGGVALKNWDISKLKVAIEVEGTLDDPSDLDNGWTVEIAIPWSAFSTLAHSAIPPKNGDAWRMNFARSEWRADAAEGNYRKSLDATTGEPYSASRWVWSPQGLVDMHYPEMWGLVFFVKHGVPSSVGVLTDENSKWSLWQVYYAMHAYHAQNGEFCKQPTCLDLSPRGPEGYQWPPKLYVSPTRFEATLNAADGSHAWHIVEDGHIWKTTNP